MRGRFAAPSGKTCEIGETGCWSAGKRQPVPLHRGVREVRDDAAAPIGRRAPARSHHSRDALDHEALQGAGGHPGDGLRDGRAQKVRRLGVGREEFEDLLGEPVSYRRFLGGLFELYAEARSKPLVGDKTPSYVTSIPKLHALWPEARFVHIVRDGRDVCLSVMNWKKAGGVAGRYATWEEDPVSTTALWWEKEGAPGPQRRRLASGGALSRSSLRRPNKPSRARVRQAL